MAHRLVRNVEGSLQYGGPFAANNGHSNLRSIADIRGVNNGGIDKCCCVITESSRPRAAAAIVSRRRRNHGPTRTRVTFLSYSASSAWVTSLPSAA